jgi:antitoxin component YwqK of YwqJK toxin-antitoxin module
MRNIQILSGLLLASILLSASSMSYAQWSDVEIKFRRDNKIQSITVWERFESSNPPEKKINANKYNRDGKLAEQIIYDVFDGTIFSRVTYAYTANGEVSQVTTWDVTHTSDGTWTNRIDNRGLITESIFRKSDGTIDARRAFRYDDHNKQIEDASYKPPTQLTERTRYSRNNSGLIIESVTEDANGNIKARQRHRYNNAGNVAETVAYDQNGTATRTTYQYDAGQNLIEKSEYLSNGTLTTKTKLGHDSRGLLVEDQESNADGSIRRLSRFTYEFYP